MRSVTDEDIQDMRAAAMWLVDELARAEQWPSTLYDCVAAAVARQPWYAVLNDASHFKERLRNAQKLNGDRDERP